MNLSSLNFLSYENRSKHSFATVRFGLFIVAQLSAVYGIVRYFFPVVWDQHLASGALTLVLTGLVCNLVLCFGEHFFHRYLLHIEGVQFLRSLTSSHRAHHKLTSIVFNDAHKTVRSHYPICDVERDDQATFPFWALIPFWAFFTPFFAVIAFSFPHIPILISGYGAIAIAHFLYETIHVAHHQSFELWWKPKLENRVFGKMWKNLYIFHQAHHANYHCNLNVAGFYGLPLADLVFGTYKKLETPLLDGSSATKQVARELTPEPRWPINWFDRTMFKRRRRMVKE